MLAYIKDRNKYQPHDVTVNIGIGHVYNQTGYLKFRVWTNKYKTIRRNSYTTIVLTPSYRVTEQETVQGVAKAAVKDLVRLTDIGICNAGEILVLNADGTHKSKSSCSTTGPWFLDSQFDPEIETLVEKYKIDFATVVTEDSDIFSSMPGKTNKRGKGSQFEASFNLIRHFAIPQDSDTQVFVMCIDGDLKRTDGFVYRMCSGLHKGFSYLIPLYWRYKYEGRATNHLVFPLHAAITHNIVRQPIGGEFAFDRKMLARFTEVHRWSECWRDFGIDIGMTITAGTSGEPIGQVVLPRKVNYVGQDARLQIGDMFVQVGRSLFNGLLDFIESHDSLQIKEATSIPIVNIETVHDNKINNNLKVELSDKAEVIGALCKFLSLFTSAGFQTDKIILGHFCDRIQNIYNEFERRGLCSDLYNLNLQETNERQRSEILEKIMRLDKSVFLTAKEWPQIVLKCFAEFQLRRKTDEKQATKSVIRNALLCVFYLRVFGFNVEAYNLPSFPDAENLIKDQMNEFLKNWHHRIRSEEVCVSR